MSCRPRFDVRLVSGGEAGNSRCIVSAVCKGEGSLVLRSCFQLSGDFNALNISEGSQFALLSLGIVCEQNYSIQKDEKEKARGWEAGGL